MTVPASGARFSQRFRVRHFRKLPWFVRSFVAFLDIHGQPWTAYEWEHTSTPTPDEVRTCISAGARFSSAEVIVPPRAGGVNTLRYAASTEVEGEALSSVAAKLCTLRQVYLVQGAR